MILEKSKIVMIPNEVNSGNTSDWTPQKIATTLTMVKAVLGVGG